MACIVCFDLYMLMAYEFGGLISVTGHWCNLAKGWWCIHVCVWSCSSNIMVKYTARIIDKETAANC